MWLAGAIPYRFLRLLHFHSRGLQLGLGLPAAAAATAAAAADYALAKAVAEAFATGAKALANAAAAAVADAADQDGQQYDPRKAAEYRNHDNVSLGPEPMRLHVGSRQRLAQKLPRLLRAGRAIGAHRGRGRAIGACHIKHASRGSFLRRAELAPGRQAVAVVIIVVAVSNVPIGIALELTLLVVHRPVVAGVCGRVVGDEQEAVPVRVPAQDIWHRSAAST